jgi:uncharacterized protein (TIGR03067 family)
MTPQHDLKTLQGTWTITALEIEGSSMPAGEAHIVIKGDQFTSISMGANYKGTVVIDESQTPKAFDLKFTEGPEQGKVNPGIYELDSKKWRICLNMKGKERPREFATRPGSGLALEILQKGKAKNTATLSGKATRAATGRAPEFSVVPAPELEGEWVMVACVSSGQPLPKEYLSMGKRIARANQITVTMGPQTLLQAQFTVDRSKAPNSIDYLLKNGQRQLGIYELEGDLLKVNFSAPGASRPTDFSTAPGDGRTYTEWKLVQK